MEINRALTLLLSSFVSSMLLLSSCGGGSGVTNPVQSSLSGNPDQNAESGGSESNSASDSAGSESNSGSESTVSGDTSGIKGDKDNENGDGDNNGEQGKDSDKDKDKGGKGKGETLDLKEGSSIHGFVVDETGEIPRLLANTYHMKHSKSGAELLYVNNADKELGFAIMFRVPQLDEADTAHVFEHSITASSEKYHSKDIFFDMNGKTYNTFINAYTTQAFTCYPLSSQSQEQLEKMADVYMSCMAAPSVLEEENYFKREALRYVLYDGEDPITYDGVVYAEDRGRLTDIQTNAFSNVEKTLYPGMIASNQIGRIDLHYQDVSYQHQIDTYNKFYHYDNALILLYGDMDIDKMLAFLDEDYLSDEKSRIATHEGKEDTAPYFEEKVPEGFEDVEINVPAYRGDSVESASQIDYAIDLSDFTEEELFNLDYFLSILDSDGSQFHKGLWDAGIYNSAGISLNVYGGSVKNHLSFCLSQAEPAQKKAFQKVVEASLEDVAANGFPEELFTAVLKQKELSDKLSLDSTNIGVDLTEVIGGYWAQTGKTNFYKSVDEAYTRLKDDKEQECFKALAGKLLSPERSALVVSIPKEGLAEEIMDEEADYLEKVKAAMSSDERDQLVRDTLEFDAWNGSSDSNKDFMIPMESLPDPEKLPEVSISSEDGIEQFSVPVSMSGAGRYGLNFDSSAINDEELYDLSLYMLLLGELSTENYERTELDTAIDTYLAGLGIYGQYPSGKNSNYSYPMLSIEWAALTEDYSDSLKLLMEILKKTDFSNAEEVVNVIEEKKEDFNPARQPGDYEAMNLAASYVSESAAYRYRLYDSGFYSYLLKEQGKLKRDGGYAEEFSDRMLSIAERILKKGRILTFTAASDKDIPTIQKVNSDLLSDLPEGVKMDAKYLNPYKDAGTVAVYLDEPVQNAYFMARLSDSENFDGSYAPYLSYLSSGYLTEELRFKGGAYSADCGVSLSGNMVYAMSYSDPKVKETIDVFTAMPDVLRKAEISEDDLEGYILNAYGLATSPNGMLSNAFLAMSYRIQGRDTDEIYKEKLEIKKAGLSDKLKAADWLEEMFDKGCIVIAGNASKMQPYSDAFDVVYDYRKE